MAKHAKDEGYVAYLRSCAHASCEFANPPLKGLQVETGNLMPIVCLPAWGVTMVQINSLIRPIVLGSVTYQYLLNGPEVMNTLVDKAHTVLTLLNVNLTRGVGPLTYRSPENWCPLRPPEAAQNEMTRADLLRHALQEVLGSEGLHALEKITDLVQEAIDKK